MSQILSMNSVEESEITLPDRSSAMEGVSDVWVSEIYGLPAGFWFSASVVAFVSVDVLCWHAPRNKDRVITERNNSLLIIL